MAEEYGRKSFYHSRLDFNVNVSPHAAADLTQDGRADEGVGAPPVAVAEQLVHSLDRRHWRLRRVLVHLPQGVGARLNGEQRGADGEIGLEVILDRDECHQVALSWKKSEKKREE